MNSIIEDIRDFLYLSGYDSIVNRDNELIVIKDGFTHSIPVKNIMIQMKDKIMNMSVADMVSIIITFHKSKSNQI